MPALLIAIGMAVAGVALATVSSRFLISSAIALARRLGVSPFVIGLSIVAVGTDLPEMANSLIASWRGQGDVNVGDSYGSMFTQLTLGLGVVPLVVGAFVLPRRSPLVQLGIGTVALAIGAFVLGDGMFGRVEAAILISLFVAAMVIAFKIAPETAEHHGQDQKKQRRAIIDILIIAASAGVLIVGAWLLVEGVVRAATHLGAPTLVVSFLGAALGTSAPEIVVSIAAARRGNHDLAAGDLIGASVADSTISVAIGPLFFPTGVTALAAQEAALVAGGGVLAVAAIVIVRKHNRVTGALLVIAYLAGATVAIL